MLAHASSSELSHCWPMGPAGDPTRDSIPLSCHGRHHPTARRQGACPLVQVVYLPVDWPIFLSLSFSFLATQMVWPGDPCLRTRALGPVCT